MSLTPSVRHSAMKGLVLFHKRPIIRLYETLALMLLTIAFFSFVFIRPTAIRILNLLTEIKQAKEVNQILAQKANDINTAKGVYANLQPQLFLLDETTPQTPSTADFLAKVDNLAQTRQIRLNNVTFEQYNLYGNSVSNKGSSSVSNNFTAVGYYPFTIVAIGQYGNLQGFLEDLESLR